MSHRSDAERVAEFPWPCDRRVAHGPHPVYCPEHGPLGTPGLCDGTQECPGVKAHPLTMIGTL